MRPPRLAVWLAGFRLRPDEREFALGDLEEEFAEIAAAEGWRAARRWYWRQGIRSAIVPPRPPVVATLTRKSRWGMTRLIADVRFAARGMARAPGFTALVVATVALGVGATTAVFTVVHTAIIRPLPFASPDRLVIPAYGTGPADAWPLSFRQLREWRDEHRVFDDLAGYFSWRTILAGDGEPEQLAGIRSSASLFSTLGVRPLRGRLFTRSEEGRGAELVVLLTESFWRRRFHADESILGRRLVLNDQTWTVIGVLPDGFDRVTPGATRAALFAPLLLNAQNAPDSLRFISTVARLREGQSVGQAQQQLLAAVRAAAPDATTQPTVYVAPMRDQTVGGSRPVLLALLGAVGCLLLITCANLANLLLARGVGRRRELAVRLAIGASRGRIIAQVLLESAMFAVLGGVVGLGLAWAAVQLLAGLPIVAQAGVYELRLDWRVLLFGVGLSLGVGVLFGLIPAWQAGRLAPAGQLSGGARLAVGGDRWRRSLIVAEVALTVVLLAGTGLLTRSLVALISTERGFDTTSVLNFGLSSSPRRYPTGVDQTRFFDEVLERIRAVRGVESAGLINDLPLGGSDVSGGVTINGRTFPPGEAAVAQKRIVSPGYFEAMGIAVRQGRSFTSEDKAGAQPVMVVSQTFADRYLSDRGPLNQQVGFNWDMDGFQTVIGVVADVKHGALADAPTPAIYVSHLQRPESSADIVVRTSTAPESLVPAIRDAVRFVDPNRPLTHLRTMQTLVDESVGPRRFAVSIIGTFAVLGLVLAGTGIFGVVSYATAQRTREFGIRVALGAASASVAGLVLRQGVWLGLLGIALGLVATLLLGGAIRAHLFLVHPADPVTLGAVSAALLIVALAASYVPARRALRIEPARALRSE